MDVVRIEQSVNTKDPKVIAKMMSTFNQKINFSSVTEIVEYDKNVRFETHRLIETDFI